MKRKLYIYLILAVTLIALGFLPGCEKKADISEAAYGTDTPYDTEAPQGTDESDSTQAPQNADEADSTQASKNPEESGGTEAPKNKDKGDEYLSVDDVKQSGHDYEKYDIKKDKVVTKEHVTTDQYNTEPVPEGKPEPVEPEEVTVNEEEKHTCSLLIECSTINNNIDDFDEAKHEIIPKNGIILAKTEVEFSEGESVFDILKRETQKNNIHMEFSFTPLYNSSYIEGIANIYEFDCGELSGWMYSVNGWFPNYGISRYKVCDGDSIEFRYTCDLGADLKQDVNR